MKYAQAILFVVAAVFVSGTTAAQSRMEEITTTARKAEENVQDVPIAISAFSKLEMERRGMRELEDVALATPGFAFEDYGGGYGVPVIRGGAQLRIQDLDATTSVYLDGVYLPRQYMLDFGTLGFDRIEIVKGPQSALFGRNAFLGAVNYVSGGPTDELFTEVRGMVGSDERYDLSAEIGGPIFGEALGARAIVAYSEFDGTWDNQNPNYDGRDYGTRGTTDNMGGWENTTVGLNLESQLGQLALDLDYYRVERFQEQQWNVRVEASFGDTNCSPTFFGGPRFYCGQIPQTFSPLPGGSPPGTESVVDPRAYLLDVETDFVQGRARFEINDSWSLVYQLGYADSEVTSAGSNDRDPLLGSFDFGGGGPFFGVNITPNGTNEYLSNELRVEFNDGPWSFLAGVFTSKIEDFDLFDFAFAPFQDPTPLNIDPEQGLSGDFFILPLTRAATDVTTNAIFARVGWESPSGRWRVGAEGRYQDEEKELDPNTLDPGSGRFKDSWTVFTPRFTVDYRISDDKLVYGSLAKGAKSGGFNNTVFDESQRSFDPDENWTFEVGSKNDFFDGKVRFNAAIFYTDWSDLQINSSPIGIPPGATPPAIVDNTGGAEIWGIELDGAWFATDILSFDYAFSYNNAEYSSGSKSSRIGLIGGCDGSVCPEDGDISGNQVQRQPEVQTNVGAALTGYFAGDWGYYARADVSYQSKQYIDELNLAWVPDRTLVNARLELSNGPWTAALWAKNLFDEEYAANSFFIATPFGTSYIPILGQQRTFGLTVTFSWSDGGRN